MALHYGLWILFASSLVFYCGQPGALAEQPDPKDSSITFHINNGLLLGTRCLLHAINVTSTKMIRKVFRKDSTPPNPDEYYLEKFTKSEVATKLPSFTDQTPNFCMFSFTIII
jgi:hypothetical protein